MKITFLGTLGNVSVYNKRHRYNASLLVSTDKGKFIIDYGEEAKPFEEHGIKDVVVTHAHPDHISGLPRSFDGTLYAHPKVLEELEGFDWNKKELPATIAGVKVSAFPVVHSTRVFTTGIALDDGHTRIVYTPDILEFKDESVLDNADIWITDAAHPTRTLRRRGNVGHMSMRTAIELAQKHKVPSLIFAHFGRASLDLDNENFFDAPVRVELAYDGYELDTEEAVKYSAQKAIFALLAERSRYTEFVPEHLSLLDTVKQYGYEAEREKLVWLKEPDTVAFIDTRKFEFSPDEVECAAVFVGDECPENMNTVMYGPRILFTNAELPYYPLDHLAFARNFDIHKYDVTKADSRELREKWAHALAWLSLAKQNRLKWSYDDVKAFAQRVFQELVRRGDTTFHALNESVFNEVVKPLVKQALYVPAPYASSIAEGEIEHVLSDKELPHDRFLALVDRTWHYGYLRLFPGVERSRDDAPRYGYDADFVRTLFPDDKQIYVHRVREFVRIPRKRLHRTPRATISEFRGSLDVLYYGELVDIPTELTDLTPLELILLHSRAHEAYPVDPERAYQLHSQVVAEMARRGMQHRILDELDERDVPEVVTLEQVLAALPERIVVYPDRVRLFGNVAASGFSKHDIDIFIQGEDDPRFERGLKDQLPPSIAERIQVTSRNAPFSPSVPIYDLAYVKKRDLHLSYEQAEFALTPKQRKEAEQSFKEDRIEPFRFFELAKTKAGYMKQEHFSVEEASRMLPWGKDEILAELKADGVNVSISKVDKRLEAYTEDGGRIDLEAKFPELYKALLSVPHDFVICGELESWPKIDKADDIGTPATITYKGRFHLNRGDLIGYLHRRGSQPDIAEGGRLMIYDVLWLDGEDIHKKPLSERIKIRNTLFPSDDVASHRLWHPKGKVLKKPEDLVRLWRNLKQWIGYDVEGLMLKPLSRPYVPKAESPVTGWVKLKQQRKGDFEVIYRQQLKPGPHGETRYKYLLGVRDDKGVLRPIGWTFATTARFKPGDIVEAQMQELRKYIDPRTGYVWYAAYRMAITSPRPEKTKPDDIHIAEKLVRVSRGGVERKPLPADQRRILQEAGVNCSLYDLVSSIDELYEAYADIETLEAQFAELDWTKLPAPKGISKWQLSARQLKNADVSKLPKGFFVFQLHGVPAPHIDFRYKENGRLQGWTFFIIKKGAVKDTADTLEEVRGIARKVIEGDTSVTKFHPNMQPNESIQCERKSSMDPGWLKVVDTCLPKGRVGSTKRHEGCFALVDCGLLRLGAQKPWFKEYFLYGKHFNRKRLVIRAVPGPRTTYWIAKLADPTPYIFTRRARQKGYAPTHSALPIELESMIPEELRWWNKPLSEAERRKRIDAAYNYLIEKGILKARPLRLNAEFAQEVTAKFVLHRIWWKAPRETVRNVPRMRYYLRLLLPKPIQFVFDVNPLYEPETFGRYETLDYGPDKNKSPQDWYDFEGELNPGHPENPNRSIPAHAEILDKGRVHIIEHTDVFIGARFEGKELKGYYVLKREDPTSPFWLLKPSPEGEHL